MRRLLLFSLTSIFAALGTAAPLPPIVRAEIEKLMSRLESSACAFNRNGTWYTATEAKSHMLTKLKYLEVRGTVQTTEQFIELAASRSSLSGQPYLVKCESGSLVESGPWLLNQLQALRSRRAKSAP